MKIFFFISIYYVIVFSVFGSSCEFIDLELERKSLKSSLHFIEAQSDTQDTLEENASLSITLTRTDNGEYPTPDPKLYPNSHRVWPMLKGLHPYIRADGFPFMEALIRLTSGVAFQSSPDLVRVLFQATYDLSEIFGSYNIDYSLCGKSLLYFCRHKGFAKWQRRVHFAVNAYDHQAISDVISELKRLNYSPHPTVSGYRIYISESFKLQAPWENLAFSPKIKEPIAIIRLYNEENEGLNYIDIDTPLKDDYIPKESWLKKNSHTFTGSKGKIKINIVGNAEKHLNNIYGPSWETHEERDHKLLRLSKEELKPALPESGWGLRLYTKPSQSFFSALFGTVNLK